MAQNIVFDYKKLRVNIFEVFGTNTALAKEMGITKESLSRKLQGKTSFTANDIIQICDILDIPCEQIGLYFSRLKGHELKDYA